MPGRVFHVTKNEGKRMNTETLPQILASNWPGGGRARQSSGSGRCWRGSSFSCSLAPGSCSILLVSFKYGRASRVKARLGSTEAGLGAPEHCGAPRKDAAPAEERGARRLQPGLHQTRKPASRPGSVEESRTSPLPASRGKKAALRHSDAFLSSGTRSLGHEPEGWSREEQTRSSSRALGAQWGPHAANRSWGPGEAVREQGLRARGRHSVESWRGDCESLMLLILTWKPQQLLWSISIKGLGLVGRRSRILLRNNRMAKLLSSLEIARS